MSGRDGRERAAFGRLVAQAAVVVIAATAVGWISFLWERSEAIRVRREVAQSESQSHCQQPNHEACEAAAYNAMSARTDEDAVDVAVWQIWLNMAGLAGLGATVFYARRAWLAAKDSADADNAALAETRRALTVTQRPWVVLSDLAVTEPMSIYAERFNTQGRLIIKNIGPTVALNVTWNAGVHTRRVPNHIAEIGAMEREGRERLKLIKAGMLLAPGETMEIGFGVTLLKNHLVGSTLPHDDTIHPFVLGCVTYSSPNDDDPHQTTFTLVIRRKAIGKGIFPHPPIRLTGGVIPLDDLEVVRWPLGHTAT